MTWIFLIQSQALVAEKESKIAEMEAASTGGAARLKAAVESVKGELSHLKQEHVLSNFQNVTLFFYIFLAPFWVPFNGKSVLCSILYSFNIFPYSTYQYAGVVLSSRGCP